MAKQRVYKPKRGDPLSRSEFNVYNLVRYGLSAREMGEKLFVSEKAVKFHLRNIYKKIGVKNRYQLLIHILYLPQGGREK